MRRIEREGGRAVVMDCDLSVRENIVRLAVRVKQEVGVPDLILNNAGAYDFHRLGNLSKKILYDSSPHTTYH